MVPYPTQVSMNQPTDSLFINTSYAFSVPVETGMTYEWICPLGNIVSGQGTASVQINFAFPGSATVTCVISNQNCDLSIEENVQAYVNTASLNTLHPDETIILFPNPAENEIRVDGTGEGNLYEIRDISGRLMAYGNFTENKIIYLDHFTPGIYILHIIHLGGEKSFRKAFIKK